ncbi:hypothetical protein RvY_01709-1 [Ramazzottius varieornatus]|uniref:Uncharacterized protein n=1 Tax=Ramazzottius varieornatus TaxID=947166 RepID=A0A1D1UI32_RAMVA|nr:hypothetical protein RvY_01709-1 [Ramazzottius varieornatus]
MVVSKESSRTEARDTVLKFPPPAGVVLVAPFSVVKIFNTLSDNGDQSVLPPLLNCQTLADGKVPLKTEGVDGRNLYLDRKEMDSCRSDCDNSQSVSIERLANALLGLEGWNLIMQNHLRKSVNRSISGQPMDLLSEEFLILLQRHIKDTGLPMLAVDIRNSILNRCTSLARHRPSLGEAKYPAHMGSKNGL